MDTEIFQIMNLNTEYIYETYDNDYEMVFLFSYQY